MTELGEKISGFADKGVVKEELSGWTYCGKAIWKEALSLYRSVDISGLHKMARYENERAPLYGFESSSEGQEDCVILSDLWNAFVPVAIFML